MKSWEKIAQLLRKSSQISCQTKVLKYLYQNSNLKFKTLTPKGFRIAYNKPCFETAYLGQKKTYLR